MPWLFFFTAPKRFCEKIILQNSSEQIVTEKLQNIFWISSKKQLRDTCFGG